MPLLRILLGSLIAGSFGCSRSDTAIIVVEVWTDYVPGEEFGSVYLELEGPGATNVDENTPVYYSAIAVLRAGYFEDVPRGVYGATAVLRDVEGSTVASRSVRFVVSDSIAGVRVAISRSCEDVDCAAGESCLAGTCAPITCTDGTQSDCDDSIACTSDESCRNSEDVCAASACMEGACVFTPDADTCPDDQYCSVSAGCIEAPRIATGTYTWDGSIMTFVIEESTFACELFQERTIEIEVTRADDTLLLVDETETAFDWIGSSEPIPDEVVGTWRNDENAVLNFRADGTAAIVGNEALCDDESPDEQEEDCPIPPDLQGGTIEIDGSDSEWAPLSPLTFSDPEGDAIGDLGSGGDIELLAMLTDGDARYLYLQVFGAIDPALAYTFVYDAMPVATVAYVYGADGPQWQAADQNGMPIDGFEFALGENSIEVFFPGVLGIRQAHVYRIPTSPSPEEPASDSVISCLSD